MSDKTKALEALDKGSDVFQKWYNIEPHIETIRAALTEKPVDVEALKREAIQKATDKHDSRSIDSQIAFAAAKTAVEHYAQSGLLSEKPQAYIVEPDGSFKPVFPKIEGLDLGALDALKNHQRQLDMDGCEVGVSRQALVAAIAFIEDAKRYGGKD